uniref:DUF148 domain-containing protein n=1 Tax=Strongyloides papillosus TaxID=174720 RepID=A0A0N5CBW7_STREA
MNLTFKLILLGSAVLISGRVHRSKPLPFLKGLNKNAVIEYHSLGGYNLTKAQFKQNLDSWAAKQNPTVKSIYDEYQANVTKSMAELKADIIKATADLTADAKAVFDKIEAVRENQNISYVEEHKQIKAILFGTTDAIRNEIRKKVLPRLKGGR